MGNNLIKLVFFAFSFITVGTNTIFSQSNTEQSDSKTEAIVIKVKGVGCSGDADRISANIQKEEGVQSCEILKAGAVSKFKVQYNPTLVSKKKLHAIIENTNGCSNQSDNPYSVKGK